MFILPERQDCEPPTMSFGHQAVQRRLGLPGAGHTLIDLLAGESAPTAATVLSQLGQLYFRVLAVQGVHSGVHSDSHGNLKGLSASAA